VHGNGTPPKRQNLTEHHVISRTRSKYMRHCPHSDPWLYVPPAHYPEEELPVAVVVVVISYYFAPEETEKKARA
jgi:hypothetical protein